MANVAKLAVELQLKNGKFASEVGKSEKRVNKFSRRVDQNAKKLMNYAKGFLAVYAGRQFANFIQSQLQAVDALGKTSDKLGIATERLAGLRLAAEQMAGVSEGQFDTALQRMTRRLAEAENGTGEAVKALDALGLSVEEIAGRKPDEQMRIIADAMQGVESQSQRLAIAFKLFDTEGAALVNMFKNGAAGLDEMQDKAQRLGLTLDRGTVAQVEAANDAMKEFTASIGAVARDLVITLAPVLQDTGALLVKMGEGFRALKGVPNESLRNIRGELTLIRQEMERLTEHATGEEIAEHFRAIQADITQAQKGGATDELQKAVKQRNALLNIVVKRLQKLDESNGKLGDLEIRMSQRLHVFGETAKGTTATLKKLDEELTTYGEILKAAGVDTSDFNVKTEELARSHERSADRVTEAIWRYGSLADVMQVIRDAQAEYRDELQRTSEASRTLTKEEVEANWQTRLNYFTGVVEKLRETKLGEYAEMLVAQERERLAIQEHHTKIIDMEQQQATALKALWQSSWHAKAQITADAFSGMSSLMQSESRSLFEIGKAAAYAQTVLSTYAAAQAQFAYYSAINPVLAYVAAASAVASGLMRAQAIKNTQFGGTAAASAQQSSAVDAMGGGGDDSSNTGGPQRPTQELIVQGMISGDQLEEIYRNAREQNIDIVGVRGG